MGTFIRMLSRAIMNPDLRVPFLVIFFISVLVFIVALLVHFANRKSE